MNENNCGENSRRVGNNQQISLGNKSYKNLHTVNNFDHLSSDMSPLPSKATGLISKNSSKANLLKNDDAQKLH